MFNARAVVFILIAVFLFFLAAATNVGLVRLVDSVLWGMLGLSLVLEWLSVTAVDARRRLTNVERSGTTPSPMKDDVVEIELELRNRRFWPRFFVSVAYEAPMERPASAWQRFFVANLSGHDSVLLSSRVKCYRRGLHNFGRVTVESQVPFGLFRRSKRKAAPLSILVYPKAYPMARLALAEDAMGPADQPRPARVGPEVVGSREYVPGDALRYIPWPNTSRLGKLAVKEMQDTSDRALTIAFDTRRSVGDGRESTLEYSIKLAASIGLHALGSGEPVRLLAGDLDGEWAEAEPFLRELALMETGSHRSLGALLEGASRSSTVIALLVAGDREGAEAVTRSAPGMLGLAAVVLRGCGEFEDIGVAGSLRRAGVPTVECHKGALPEAIAALEEAGHSTARTHRARVRS